MSHEIFGERFLGNRKPAWHGLGQVFDAPIGALEAIEASGCDYEVSLQPIRVQTTKGGWSEVDNKVAIVRHPTPDDDTDRILGYASPTYGLLQNTEIGEILDPLTEKWPVETCGALRKGESLFISLKSGAVDIKGDPVEQYFLFTDTKTGSKSAIFAVTDVRVVCQNTLSNGLRSAIIRSTLPHHKDIQSELVWRTGLLEELQQAQAQVVNAYNEIAKVQLTEKDIKRVLEVAYTYPRKPTRLQIAEQSEDEGLLLEVTNDKDWLAMMMARTDKQRELVREVFGKFNDEIEQRELANTGWALYNAVVEWEDFRGKETEGSLYSALFGDRAKAKQHAFAEILRTK